MKANTITLREFLENPVENSDSCSNFYDWFCSDKTLENRMLAMVPKLKFLVKEGILNPDKVTVWFKNNCPCDGSLYDDFRINAINEDETFLGGFCPKTGHDVENKCSVWTLEPEFKQIEFLNWLEFKKEVKNNKEFKEILIKNFSV